MSFNWTRAIGWAIAGFIAGSGAARRHGLLDGIFVGASVWVALQLLDLVATRRRSDGTQTLSQKLKTYAYSLRAPNAWDGAHRAIYAAIAALGMTCIGLIVTIALIVLSRENRDALPPGTREWETIDTGFCTFRYPPTMEVRKGITLKAAVAVLQAQAGIEDSADFVLQPKGMDSSTVGSFDTYGRILVSTEAKQSGDFPTQSQLKRFSAQEIREAESAMQEAVNEELARVNAKAPNGKKATITEWRGAKREQVGNRMALVISYQRQLGSNPPVALRSYVIFDDRLMHQVILSFRENESDLWERDFNTVLATMRFEN